MVSCKFQILLPFHFLLVDPDFLHNPSQYCSPVHSGSGIPSWHFPHVHWCFDSLYDRYHHASIWILRIDTMLGWYDLSLLDPWSHSSSEDKIPALSLSASMLLDNVWSLTSLLTKFASYIVYTVVTFISKSNSGRPTTFMWVFPWLHFYACITATIW